MKKAILFVDNNLTVEDSTFLAKLKLDGYRAVASNGNIKKGFEDSCDKVFAVKDFDHIKKWCERSFIEYEVVVEGDPVDTDGEEKPKRGRKPANATKVESSEDKED